MARMDISERDAPHGSLIATYAAAEGHYTDAFAVALPDVALPTLIEAFYTTPLFKLERLVLRVFGRVRSTDAQARALAADTAEQFAVWHVEGRREDEILLADKSGRTKSWLSVRDGHVWFGSVVVPVERKGKLVLGPVFDSLLGAHQMYSRALLSGTVQRLQKIDT